MKKKAFAILTLCISLFAAVALVGCGGSGGATGSGGGGGAEKPAVDMRTDFIWFKVEVPEGVEVTDVAGDTADRAQFKFTESEHASDRFIPVFDPDKNADELFDYEAKWNASFEWTENDPVKYNGKTWRNASYTHSGGVTTEYFTEAGGGSVYVRIDNVEEHKDAVETMMKSWNLPTTSPRQRPRPWMLSSTISRSSAKAPTACSSAVLAQPGCKVRLLASRFFVFESARSHHHIEHIDEFLSPGAAAQAKDTGS